MTHPHQPPHPHLPASTGSAAASPLRNFLARVSRRLAWIAAAEGAATGLALAAVIAIAAWWGRGWVVQTLVAGLALAALGICARMIASSRHRRHVAARVEQNAPGCRNVVITAAELLERPAVVRPDIGGLVIRDANRAIANLDPALLFPARRAAAMLGAGTLLWATALVLVSARPLMSSPPADVAVESVAITGVEVVITPPSYTGRPTRTVRDPSRIDAIAGSRIALTVRATAAAVTLETIDDARRTLLAEDARTFTGDVIAAADGFIAIEANASGGRPGVRRLIGLTVIPDQPPRVRITAPGRDLFLPAATGTIDLVLEADDDIALGTLRMRYTKVSGSGERFTFTEGETPLTITRTSAQAWRARGILPLGALELGAGDVVVYRGVATDRRPGAAPIESDAFIIEITSPGATPSEGFAADDEIDRNAVSQQMVILKTERLLERRSTMTAESIAEEARNLAAEQRRVRAEFVFMMGGELAEEVAGDVTGISELHEEEEAEAGDDILAGRLANRGRIALVRAIRAMSGADARLIAVDVEGALQDELAALEHLQAAFSRTRYILRTLTLRERLDLTRRLSGVLTDASRSVRPVPEAVADPRVVALRGALSGVADLAGTIEAGDTGADAAVRATMLAQRVLRIDPSAGTMQAIAARLGEAGEAIANGRGRDARDLLDRAALELAAVVRASLIDAPPRAPSLEARRLDGALGDALRGPGGPR